MRISVAVLIAFTMKEVAVDVIFALADLQLQSSRLLTLRTACVISEIVCSN